VLRTSDLLKRGPLAKRFELLNSNRARLYLGHHHIYCSGTMSRRHESHAVSSGNAWYYHANSIVNIVDDSVRNLLHSVSPNERLWTGSCDNAIHRDQRFLAKPLKPKDWPKDLLGYSWPSTPSIPEWMEMLRKGIIPSERPIYQNRAGETGFTSVTQKQVRENLSLATRIVANNVVGIRSSVKVPEKLLRYFRYRQNFLILICSWKIPLALVRFLISQWIQAPYSLWLRTAVPFKKFLKSVPTSLVLRATRWWKSAYYVDPPQGEGSVSPSYELSSEYNSDGGSDLDWDES